ncbi:MAG: hypothetical protein HKL96_10480 [Phycisphaerales bacterium]|nr:hypothetical protein [Phycisphaerales bacterium]
MVAQCVNAIQPMALMPYPPNATSTQQELFRHWQLRHTLRIARSLPGNPVLAPFTVVDVRTTREGGYEVTGALDWKASPRGGALGRRPDDPPVQIITFRSGRQRIAGWKVGSKQTVYALVESVSGYSGGRGDYVRLTVSLKLLAFRPPIPPHATVAPAAPDRFIIYLKNGGKIRASACVRKGSDYDVTTLGLSEAISISTVAKVIRIGSGATTKQ